MTRIATESDQNSLALRLFVKRTMQFVLMPLLLYIPYLPIAIWYGDAILCRAKGPSLETQVDQQFTHVYDREFDLLFLGNSRIYRGINPDQFDISSHNFACDNDTFNQMFHKLKWLRDNRKDFRYLVMGVDYFQFSFISDRRNYAYSHYFDDSYLADYGTTETPEKPKNLRTAIRSLNPKYLFSKKADRPFLRDNGQYIKPGVASPTDSVVRETTRLPLQVNYFEQILSDCRKHDMQVFLCVLPVRSEEFNAYHAGAIEEFYTFIESYTSDECILLDYSRDPSFTVDDYTDITHLNEVAADRFSGKLNARLGSYLNRRSIERGYPQIAERSEVELDSR